MAKKYPYKKAMEKEYSEAEIDAALDLTASGATVEAVAGSLGLSVYRFGRYCEEHPTFAKLFQRHREIGYISRAEALPDTIKFGMFNDSNHLRVFVDTEKWLLSKFHTKLFGDKQTVTHEYVDVGGALTDARRRARVVDVTPQVKRISGRADEEK